MAEAYAFRVHHPGDDVSTAAARAQTVPQILARRDHQRWLVIVMEGHSPIRSAPWRFSFTPRDSASRSTEISRFSRSISLSGMRAIGFASFRSLSGVLPKTLSRGFCIFLIL